MSGQAAGERFEVKWGPHPMGPDGYLYNANYDSREGALAVRDDLMARGWTTDKIVVDRVTVERVAGPGGEGRDVG